MDRLVQQRVVLREPSRELFVSFIQFRRFHEKGCIKGFLNRNLRIGRETFDRIEQLFNVLGNFRLDIHVAHQPALPAKAEN